MNTRGAVVFTDLDGTLLDHDTYDFSAAKPALEKLCRLGIPVIPVTSKTYAEVLLLRAKLELETPFVVENGAAIFIPKGYFSFSDDALIDEDDYWCKVFSQRRECWISVIDNFPANIRKQIETFSEMDHARLAEVTGLSQEEAVLANERQFSEPILWHGSNDEIKELEKLVGSQGYTLFCGGRFLHLTNGYDKGQALAWLKQQFMRQWPALQVRAIALGDSGNDVDMLEAADQAVVIRNPSGTPISLNNNSSVIRSLECGPKGWASCLNQLLELGLN